MAVHRKRPSRPRTPGTIVTTRGAVSGGGDLGAAAGIVYDRALEFASWSRKITASLDLRVSGNVATIEAPVEPGYAAEFRVRHPLFGDREHWYGPPGERFLLPAITGSADAAMRRYAQKIDKMARAAGFE
jgi:hypothetical protein